MCKLPIKSKMELVISKAEEDDRCHIMRLLKEVNMHYIPSEEMPSLTYENYFVAKINGKIVGFCGYKILSSEEAKTELMTVDKEYRGYGIGYKLQEYRMQDMIKKGIKTLITNTDLPNTISWYKKHFGYKEIGKLKKFHEFGDQNINEWTTLKTDLESWSFKRKDGLKHE